MYRLKQKTLTFTAFLFVVVSSSFVHASSISEIEPNDDFSNAQLISGQQFSTFYDSDVADSDTIPHVTIIGDQNSGYDYYQFVAVAGAEYIFDIDYALNSGGSFDSYLNLYDVSGNSIANDDDSSITDGGTGSTHSYDSYLEYTFIEAGSYYIRVGSCCASSIPDAGTYKLQISTANPVDVVGGDTDFDGIPDDREVEFGTDINNADTDGDGMSDGWEVTYGFDPTVDDGSLDADGDGYSNSYEAQNGGDPRVADHDLDGISDAKDEDDDNDGLTDLEELSLGTNPFSTDTDGDGWDDSFEVENQLDPLLDDRGFDVDYDGLTALEEINAGTDPQLYDTDGDGLSDGDEVNTYGTDPVLSDTDNDGLTDGYEIQTSLTNPLLEDSDSDEMPDGWEVQYGLNPNLGTDDRLDSDGDGWLNIQEYQYSTSPLNSSEEPTILSSSGLYSITGSSQLILIDLETGEYETIGSLGISDDYEGLAVSPTTGLMYAAGDSGRGLYRIDKDTGEATLIGTMSDVDTEYGLSFDGVGNLYLIDGGQLFQVNVDTAATSLINTGDYGDALAWYQGAMYSIDSSDVLRRIDLTTGDITIVGNLGIDVNSQSGLTAVGDRLIGLSESGGQLFSIDVQTGAATAVSTTNTDLESLASFTATTTTGDNDSLNDDWEDENGLDSSNPNDAKLDSDNDGLINLQEYLNGGDPLNPDSDNDGITDGDEFFVYRTDLNDGDSDDDDMLDGYEVANGLDPLSYDRNNDLDGDGLSNYEESQLNTDANNTDTDTDGASDFTEESNGTNPLLADTDGDGMSDGWEAEHSLNALADDSGDDIDGDNLSNLTEFGLDTDPRNTDSDGDGLDDDTEVNVHGTNPALADSDNDGLNDNEEITSYNTDPNVADSDSDGMTDGWEVDEGLNPISADAAVDSDNDGLSNLEEFNAGSSPSLVDTDGDGITDAQDTDNESDNGVPVLSAVPAEKFMAANAFEYQRGMITLDVAFLADFSATDAVDSVFSYRAYIDGEVLSINDQDELFLPTGKNVVEWAAIDQSGNVSNKLEQIINVYPQVSFAQTQSYSGEGRTAEIQVQLSGESPEYPVTIEIAIDTVNSTIAADDTTLDLATVIKVVIPQGDLEKKGTVVAVPVTILADTEVEEDEKLFLTLQSVIETQNVSADFVLSTIKGQHELIVTERNLIPVVSTRILQNGVETAEVNPTAGEVSVEVVIEDLNGEDSHTLIWQLESLGLSLDASNQMTIDFDPSSLTDGQYIIVLEVEDDGENSIPVTKTLALQVVSLNEDKSPAVEETSSSKSSGGAIHWMYLMLLFMFVFTQRTYRKK
jgi:hypothetical protein